MKILLQLLVADLGCLLCSLYVYAIVAFDWSFSLSTEWSLTTKCVRLVSSCRSVDNETQRLESSVEFVWW